MNIKQIIREEMDSDWGFITDSSPYENVKGLEEHFREYMVTILDKCECSLGGETTTEKEVNFIEYLEHTADGYFFVIELKKDMGVLDIAIEDSEVSIKYFIDKKSWEDDIEIPWPEKSKDIEEKTIEHFEYLIPDMVDILKGMM